MPTSAASLASTALPPDIEGKKALATDWFADLRDRICAVFEEIEDEGAPAAGMEPGAFRADAVAARRP